MSNVSNIVKTIQDIMRKDAGTYGDAQRLEQLAGCSSSRSRRPREGTRTPARQLQVAVAAHMRWSAWASNEEGDTGRSFSIS